ncbi:MAG: alkaline phosphatase family protein, partial [Candidatus Eremiobacteraeota bacterium]|nr:alkaline phosphatase family protein [Candidatus Eremiobacteraeota bacterium]
MLDTNVARSVEARLQRHRGLLRGGVSLSNAYFGEARRPLACAPTRPSHYLKLVRPPFVVPALSSAWTELASLLHSQRRPWWKELGHLPERLLSCGLLQELITLNARLEIQRGRWVVLVNFLGYDEKAHLYGPDSHTAMTYLSRLDGCIERIAAAAEGCELMVWSDHGQQSTVPYRQIRGLSLRKVVARVMGEAVSSIHFRWPGARVLNPQARVKLAAIGPVGHLYLPRPEPSDWLARELVCHQGVPAVLTRDGKVFRRNGPGRLDASLLGPAHPWPEQTLTDLGRLIRHFNSGDLILLGFQPELPLSFADELGAHGGPGPEEVNAFALLPARMTPPSRLGDLRRLALEVLPDDFARTNLPARPEKIRPPHSTGVR